MVKEDTHDRPGSTAWAAIEPYWELVDIYSSPEAFESTFSEVPTPTGHLLAVWWANSEICNGGLHQFFRNSTGILAPEALAGFRAINATGCAEALDAALRLFDSPFPRDHSTRQHRLSGMELKGDSRKEWDPFYSLDDRYYASKRSPDIMFLADQYAARENDG